MEQKDFSYLGTYEYLPGSSTETEPEQFLVVENNGTFVLNMNKDVQYVTQMQDVKEVLESVQSGAVYDTATQQYYVDVDNTSQLISVSDSFIIPNTENPPAYTDGNNYLLQSIPEDSIELPRDPEASNEEFSELVIQDTSIDTVPVPESTLTEVTLNDNQWKMLEQNGWVLLEFNDKIFLLDTLGLHDITDNQKMIQKFKDEIATVLQKESTNAESSSNQKPQTPPTDVLSVEEEEADKIEMPIPKIECGEITPQISSAQTINLAIPPPPKLATRSLLKRPSGTLSLLKPIRKPKAVVKVTKPKPKKVSGLLRFETPLKMEEIPQKIVLGKSAAGKTLVAKVTAVKTNSLLAVEKSEEPPKGDDQVEMDKLYRVFVTVGSQLTCEARDITKAELVIRQLLAVPATRAPLLDNYLLVTMVKNETDKKDPKPPVMVTGRVANVNGCCVFVHVPHMLQKMMEDSTEEEYNLGGSGSGGMGMGAGVGVRCARARSPVLHVHVAATARAQTNITFAIKKLPLQAVSKKLPSLHACSSCAKRFDSELEVLTHQEECLLERVKHESEMIDEPLYTNTHASITDLKNQTKECPFCKVNIKLKNFKKHQRCHFAAANTDKSNTITKAPFRCKMCPSMYFYASSLSKHIMKAHIGPV